MDVFLPLSFTSLLLQAVISQTTYSAEEHFLSEKPEFGMSVASAATTLVFTEWLPTHQTHFLLARLLYFCVCAEFYIHRLAMRLLHMSEYNDLNAICAEFSISLVSFKWES